MSLRVGDRVRVRGLDGSADRYATVTALHAERDLALVRYPSGTGAWVARSRVTPATPQTPAEGSLEARLAAAEAERDRLQQALDEAHREIARLQDVAAIGIAAMGRGGGDA